MRYELAIAAHDFPNTGGWLQNVKEGDVVMVRPAMGIVGTKELHDFLWLTVDLLPHEVEGLMSDERDLTGQPVPGGLKRVFAIPFTTLKTRMSSFESIKARDTRVVYQPFVTINKGHLTPVADMDFAGLVVNRKLGMVRSV